MFQRRAEYFHNGHDGGRCGVESDIAAAVLRCCDLLISSDTAIVHLAGALGVRTWLALAHRPDWRWGLEGHSTPWYPSIQLFRQPQPRAWNLVFEAIATALKEQFP